MDPVGSFSYNVPAMWVRCRETIEDVHNKNEGKSLIEILVVDEILKVRSRCFHVVHARLSYFGVLLLVAPYLFARHTQTLSLSLNIR